MNAVIGLDISKNESHRNVRRYPNCLSILCSKIGGFVSLVDNAGTFVHFLLAQMSLYNKKKPDFSSFYKIKYVGIFVPKADDPASSIHKK
ncbi:hypothetical protein GC093_01720 [Paenibacillus sp. LMG 31456]|uniref:Uncharacterized protein n=1 Tax=Paenibacillus foliorum TaxID=2654974 RepID=A0A972JXX4_9BACL|nr:hypothetical protein [Paenibacillus foliorum]NOU91956.1 hypothetical protein [Paenibacillus foliorum]